MELETEISVLSARLREAQERQGSLDHSLTTAREAMELYQKTSRQDVSYSHSVALGVDFTAELL